MQKSIRQGEHDLHNVIRDSVKWKSQTKDNEVDFYNHGYVFEKNLSNDFYKK